LSRQALVILGGSLDQVFLLRTAEEMGLDTIVLDGNPDAPGLKAATYSAAIDFSRVDRVVQYLRDLQSEGVEPAGITTMGSEVPHLLTKIGETFGWSAPTRETSSLATDKYAMKRRFLEQGIPVPAFALVRSTAEVVNQWRAWGCMRVVLKPTDRAGSRGVRVLDDEGQVAEAFDYAQTSSKAGHVLVEQFLDGPQISTETIVYDDRAVTPGFADRVYEGMEAFRPQIMENGGWFPAHLGPADTQRVVELAERSALALGIRRGVAKGDVVFHPDRGPVMIEMAARLSGGDFSESLVPLGCGVNYVRAVVEIALGRAPTWELLEPRWEQVAVNRYFFTSSGLLEAIDGFDELKSWPGVKKLETWYRPGERIPEIQNHGQRAGVMVIVGRNRAEVQRTVEEAYRRLRFKIDGEWCSGCPEGFLGEVSPLSPPVRQGATIDPTIKQGGLGPDRETVDFWRGQGGDDACIGTLLHQEGAFSIVDCEVCGFKHVAPMPTEAELQQIYSHEYYQKEKPLFIERHTEDREWWDLVYRERYEILEAHLPTERRRIVDVGAGPGFFLRLGLERGWDTIGLEPSSKAAAHARGLGVTVIEEFLGESTSTQLGVFDAVHLCNVLEHVPDPKGMLARAWNLLRPGGLALVVAPNDFNPFQQTAHEVCRHPRWWIAPPHHLNYFDHRSLERLLHRVGFEVLDVTSSFPIDLFLLMGDRYVGDDELGRRCHGKRMSLERRLDEAGRGELKRQLYRSFSELGLGREVVVLARRAV